MTAILDWSKITFIIIIVLNCTISMQISLLFTILHCYRRKKLKNEKKIVEKRTLAAILDFLKSTGGIFGDSTVLI